MDTDDFQKASGAWSEGGGGLRRAKGLLAGLRVLIVEDDALVAQAESRFLSRCGAATARVSTVQHAIRALVPDVWHLVLVDLCLPDGHGIRVVEHARTLAPRPGILILSDHPHLLGDPEVRALADLSVPKRHLADHLTTVLEAIVHRSRVSAPDAPAIGEDAVLAFPPRRATGIQ